MIRLSLVLALGFAVGACDPGASNPAEARTTYGRPVDATSAFPAPAVAAEESLYVGDALAVGGRITDVESNGCELWFATNEGVPLLVTAKGTDDAACAWRVPTGTDGFAVAAGRLRAEGDTLRLTANGVRVTPVRLSSPDS